MPPSVLLSEGDGSWSKTDRLIAVALTIFEASRCTGCGRGLDEVWDTGADVVVQEHTCAGCKAREEHVESKPDGLGPGVKLAINRVDIPDDSDEVMPEFGA